MQLYETLFVDLITVANKWETLIVNDFPPRASLF